MSKDRKWSDLTKKEKDNAKATAAGIAGAVLLSSLNKSGKWSVARWWLGFYLLICIDVRVMRLPGYEILWTIYGIAVLIIFSKKLFK